MIGTVRDLDLRQLLVQIKVHIKFMHACISAYSSGMMVHGAYK